MNNKLLIEGYKEIGYTTKLGYLYLQINPESYKLTKSVKFAPREKTGNAAQTPAFNKYSPSSLSFEVIFDSTGIIPTSGKTVEERIEELEELIYQMNGDTREPAYVKIGWGNFIFNGRLDKADYSYTLFKPNGAPLRVKIGLSFTDARSVEEEQAIKAQKAAEGEYKVLKEGDTLPKMCKDKYGSEAVAGIIANLNSLTSFRDIKPGTSIWFPKAEN